MIKLILLEDAKERVKLENGAWRIGKAWGWREYSPFTQAAIKGGQA